MATVDNYKIKITVDGQDQVVDLNDSLTTLQGTLTKTAAAGVAAFSALAASAVHMADGLVDLADATGISVGKLYQLSAALEASGGKFDDGGKILMAFSRTIGDIEQGSDKTIDALKRLGVSGSELENLSDEQLFKRTVEGLANMQDGFTKTQIAVDLFGKSAATVDFKKLADGLNQAVDPNLERNLKLAADAVGSMEVAFRNLQLAALQAIAPILQAISQFELTAEDAKKAIQVLGALVAGAFSAATVIAIVRTVSALKTLAQTIRAAATAQALLTGLIPVVGAATVIAAIGGATAAYLALGKAMEDAGDAKDKLEGAAPGAPETPAGTPQREVGKTPAEKALDALKATTAEMRVQNAAALEYERTINGTIGLSQEIADIKKIEAQLEQDRAKNEANYEKQIATLKADTSKNNQAQIDELTTQKKLADDQLVAMAELKKDAVTRSFAEKQTATELQKQLGILQQQSSTAIAGEQARLRAKVISGELTQKEMDDQLALFKMRQQGRNAEEQLEQRIAKEKDNNTKKQLQNDLDALRVKNAREVADYEATKDFEKNKANSFVAGITEALSKTQNMMTPFEKGVKMTESVFQNLENAIMNFAETGKLSFKDLALSIIKDLLKIELQSQATAIFSSMRKAGGNILSSILSSIFRAEGGPVKGNSPYIVGEKGPELFVPKSAGTIIPNNQLNASTEAMATGTGRVNAPVTNNYITNNISALDAKSVAQLFAENRKTLLGVTETARRELAYGT